MLTCCVILAALALFTAMSPTYDSRQAHDDIRAALQDAHDRAHGIIQKRGHGAAGQPLIDKRDRLAALLAAYPATPVDADWYTSSTTGSPCLDLVARNGDLLSLILSPQGEVRAAALRAGVSTTGVGLEQVTQMAELFGTPVADGKPG